jgi:hypothetical protein
MRALRLGLALILTTAGPVLAAPPPADPATSVKADQVPVPASTAATDADQIAPPRSNLTGEQQLSRTLAPADAPSGGTAPGQSRDATVARIGGHDRCDAALPDTDKRPECARILDQHADAFIQDQPVAPAPVDATNTDSSGLVNTIVNGGTGTVVAIPPPKSSTDPHP